MSIENNTEKPARLSLSERAKQRAKEEAEWRAAAAAQAQQLIDSNNEVAAWLGAMPLTSVRFVSVSSNMPSIADCPSNGTDFQRGMATRPRRKLGTLEGYGLARLVCGGYPPHV